MSGWGKGGSGSASGWKGRWNSKGNPKGGKGKLAEKRDFAKKVPWENRLSKWFLRPYVEQGGSPFSGGRGVAESSLLTSWHLSNVLDETCSEYCARQGIALSEGAANCEVGAFLLQYHFADRAATEGLKKAGIEQLLKALQSPEGKKFLESCHYLNTAHTDVDRSEAATTQAVKRFVRFFTADRADKEVAFRQALRFAARLYLFAFEGLEALTALGNPKAMAAGVHKVGQQTVLPPESTEWLRDPENPEALLAALVSSFQKQKLDTAATAKGGGYERGWEEDDTWAPPGLESQGDSRAPWDDGAVEERPFKTRKGKGGKPLVDALASDNEDGLGATKDIDLASSEDEAPPPAGLDVSEWPLEKIDALKELLTELENKLGGKDRPSIQQVQAALQEIPGTILKHQCLQNTVGSFLKKTRYPKTENLKTLLKALKDMAVAAETAWKQ